MKALLFGLIGVTFAAGIASAEVLTSACDDRQKREESACRTRGKSPSDLLACQVRANHRYANCVQRTAGL